MRTELNPKTSPFLNDVINTFRLDKNSEIAAWGDEMAAAIKYELECYDYFPWITNEAVGHLLASNRELFTVPGGNLLVAFGQFMFVHITGTNLIATRYGHAKKKKFHCCPVQLCADFDHDDICISDWFLSPPNMNLSVKQEKEHAGRLFHLTGNVLTRVNSAVQATAAICTVQG